MAEVTESADQGVAPASQADRKRAWIDAGYWRIGGAGMSDPLWCCPRCYAATPRPDEHAEWHDRRGSAQRRAHNFLRRAATHRG